jgi:hypothetical protein
MPPLIGNVLRNVIPEMGYTLIISVLCFVIFRKTKEISELAGYKGIQFFRYAFLFFGGAYLSRLLLHLFMIGSIALPYSIRRGALMPLSMLVTVYFSTMALMCLAYSTVWKRIPEHTFWVSTHVVAIVLLIVLLLSQNLRFMLFFQLGLFILSIFVVEVSNKKKISRMRIVYLMIFLFWILNLLLVGNMVRMGLEAKLALQAVSMLIFLFVYYRVTQKIK